MSIEQHLSTPETTPVMPADLAAGFEAELNAEDGIETSTPQTQAQEPPEQEPDAPDIEAAEPDEESADSVTAETAPEIEQEDGPEADPEPPAIDAPSGMSEADKALFDALPPEQKSWLAKREAERQADYTRKTQAVAEDSKKVQAAQGELLKRLKSYDDILTTFTAPDLAPPDPALRDEDPMAYDDAMAAYLQAKHNQDIARSEQVRIRQEAQAALDNQQRAFWAEQAEELKRIAPDLADSSEKGQARRQAVYSYAVAQGFSKADMDKATAQEMAILDKARAWDAAMAAKSKAKPAPKPAPRAVQPGPARAANGRFRSNAQAVQNFAENPSRDGLAEAFLAELNSER